MSSPTNVQALHEIGATARLVAEGKIPGVQTRDALIVIRGIVDEVLTPAEEPMPGSPRPAFTRAIEALDRCLVVKSEGGAGYGESLDELKTALRDVREETYEMIGILYRCPAERESIEAFFREHPALHLLAKNRHAMGAG